MVKFEAITIFVSVSLVIAASPSCRVTEMRTKQNFDISRYLGPWHEIFFLLKSIYEPTSVWEDYTETYSLLPNGSMALQGVGRTSDTHSGSCSILYTGTVVPTGVSGKFNLTSFGTEKNFWVLDTDYTGFSVTYGCRKIDSDGECKIEDKLDTKVWSRKTSLSPSQLEHVKHVLRDACVNLPELRMTPVYRECDLSSVVGK